MVEVPQDTLRSRNANTDRNVFSIGIESFDVIDMRNPAPAVLAGRGSLALTLHDADQSG